MTCRAGAMTSRKGHRVTITDVAEAAGVSPASVSLAINGKGRLSPATRERILAVSAALGYTPDARARALRTGTSRVLGISFGMPPDTPGSPADYYTYRQVLAEVMRLWLPLSYGLLVLPPAHGAAQQHAHSIDGALVVNPTRDDPALAHMRRTRTPFVTIGRPTDATSADSWVESDRVGGVRLALDSLACTGDGPVMLLTQDRWTTTHVDDVRSTYLQWCRARGQAPHELVVPAPVVVDSVGQLKQAVTGIRPCGLFASHWELGYDVMRALRGAGVALPREFGLVTWGDPDSLLPDALDLTTVATGISGLVQRATEILLGLLAGGPPRQETLPVRLMSGATSHPTLASPSG